jgi:hypothetical protein
MNRALRTLIVMVALAVVAMAADRQSSKKPLQTFQLQSSVGSPVNSTDLALSGKWLLIYVNANNRPSELLLSQMKTATYAPFADHIVIIVGGVAGPELAEWVTKYQGVAGAHWYADPNREAFRKLELHGVPMEIGMKDSSIEWMLSGMTTDTAAFQSTLLDWLKSEQ